METAIYISLPQLREWLQCCENLRVYAPDEKNPLLDILYDVKGCKVKVVFKNEQQAHGP